MHRAEAILVILRDGRHLHGFLRSYDQYGNIVLHDTIERVYTSTGGVATCPVGTFVVRGENIALLGESVRCCCIVVYVMWKLIDGTGQRERRCVS